jgi:hypothetical protein
LDTLLDQGHYHAEKGNPFHEGGGNDHGGLDLSAGFRLTGDAFHGTSTYLTDANTGTDNG